MGRRITVVIRGQTFTIVYHATPDSPAWYFCPFEAAPDFLLSSAEVASIEDACAYDLEKRRVTWNAALAARRARLNAKRNQQGVG